VLALGDVVVAFQDGHWPPLFVTLEAPTAGHHHFRSIRFGIFKVSFPTPAPLDFRNDIVERYRKNGTQELVRVFSNRLFRCKPVQFLGSAIPVRYDLIHIANEDRITREIEKPGLLGPYRHFPLKLIARLKKVALHAASNVAKPSDQ
jgi:hypothetical protein